MAQEERYGTRGRHYSAWHRRMSTQRFIGIENAQLLAMIDLDASLYVEYDDQTKEPLALIETARDVDQQYKSATVTCNLAKRTVPPVPCYIVLYKLANTYNPADRQWQDISGFRVRRLWPEPPTGWVCYSPEEWAKQLLLLRRYCAHKVDEMLMQPDEIPF